MSRLKLYDSQGRCYTETEVAAIFAELERRAAPIESVVDGIIKRSCEFQKGIPTIPGIYNVRGWLLGQPMTEAVVEVNDINGRLMHNLHRENTERDLREWKSFENMNPGFEWRLIEGHG